MKFHILLYREKLLIIYTVVKTISGSGFNVFCGTIKNQQRKLLSRKILENSHIISCYCNTIENTGDIMSLVRQVVGEGCMNIIKIVFA